MENLKSRKTVRRRLSITHKYAKERLESEDAAVVNLREMNLKGSAPAIGIALALLSPTGFAKAATSYVPAAITAPEPPPREFRGVWIATVGNIDWPSKPGLPVEQQKAEMLAMLNRAAQLNLNAVVLQVRPASDAIYESRIEPWSGYITGTMGKAPAPFYDPLEFAVREAHKRGLELHAWFNPYRAGVLGAKWSFSANHVSRTHPKMVHKYGKYLWLDPGDKEAQNYSLKVVMDVVDRYDIDGVHFDDYFYPYKEEDAQGREMDFPDDATWQKYQASGGTMSRGDWRRDNINTFVHRLYNSIKAAKPWVKFGVAPFGIWQPGQPPQIKGFDAYNVLYCDSRKWLMDGWVDYCSPQLYLGDRFARAKFSNFAEMVDGAKPEAPEHLAGHRFGKIRQAQKREARQRHLARRGICERDKSRPRTMRRHGRRNPLEHEGLDAGPRRPGDGAAKRRLRGTRARAGVAVAGLSVSRTAAVESRCRRANQMGNGAPGKGFAMGPSMERRRPLAYQHSSGRATKQGAVGIAGRDMHQGDRPLRCGKRGGRHREEHGKGKVILEGL